MLSSVELYHPDTGTFELLPTTMSSNRAFHTATILANGLVDRRRQSARAARLT
jgi:hypothetical protein